MWPFKKKAEEKTPAVDHIGALQNWRPIGSSFTYLGRRMVVCGHYRIEYGGGMTPMRVVPCLQADYADDHGVIRHIEFSHAEAVALMGAGDYL